VDTEVHVDPSINLGEGAAQLAYRIAREGLRNVVKHADATTAVVEIRREDGWVHVLVADDGKGVDPSVIGEHDEHVKNGVERDLPEVGGHLGLRLLRDSVRDAHGDLELIPNRPQGTRLRARFLEDVPGF
jgi:signal transduction histidine kinase